MLRLAYNAGLRVSELVGLTRTTSRHRDSTASGSRARAVAVGSRRCGRKPVARCEASSVSERTAATGISS